MCLCMCRMFGLVPGGGGFINKRVGQLANFAFNQPHSPSILLRPFPPSALPISSGKPRKYGCCSVHLPDAFVLHSFVADAVRSSFAQPTVLFSFVISARGAQLIFMSLLMIFIGHLERRETVCWYVVRTHFVLDCRRRLTNMNFFY